MGLRTQTTHYTPKFKAKVALEAIRGEQTRKQLASQFHVRPAQIDHWRKTAIEQLADLFADGRKAKTKDGEAARETLLTLFEEINRLKVELDWLKNKVRLLD